MNSIHRQEEITIARKNKKEQQQMIEDSGEIPTEMAGTEFYHDIVIKHKDEDILSLKNFYFQYHLPEFNPESLNREDYYTPERIVDYYSRWVKEPYYFIIKDTEYSEVDSYKTSYLFCLGAKRGNEVYSWKTGRRFTEIEEMVKNMEYFNPMDRNNKRAYTSVIIETLTYNQKEISIQEAWQNIGKDYTLWMSKLRQEYGRVSAIRSWEAHKSGYPHIHAVLFFQDHQFHAHWYTSKNSNWRLDTVDKDKIASFWKRGHSYTIAGYNNTDAIKYVGKYLMKYMDGTDKKGILTRAMTWFYRKRAFSLSTKLSYLYIQSVITIEEPTNHVYTYIGGAIIYFLSFGYSPSIVKWREDKVPEVLMNRIRELEEEKLSHIPYM